MIAHEQEPRAGSFQVEFAAVSDGHDHRTYPGIARRLSEPIIHRGVVLYEFPGAGGGLRLSGAEHFQVD
jgi:hypothetical protein